MLLEKRQTDHSTLRPTIAQIEELRCERVCLEAFIATLKSVSPDERLALLDAVVVSGRHVRVPQCLPNEPEQGEPPVPERPASEREDACDDGRRALTEHGGTEAEKDSSAEEPDLALFASVDETGIPSSFGPFFRAQPAIQGRYQPSAHRQ